MSEVAPIGRPEVASLNQTGRPARSLAVTSTPARDRDQVELSLTAQLLSRLSELPDVRQDLVDRVKAQIAAGQYETPQKLDAAIEALLEDLD